MARRTGSAIIWAGATIVVAGVLGAGAMAMTGLPVRFSAAPVSKPKPLPVPARTPSTAFAQPADPAHYEIKGAMTITGPLKHGDYYWDDKNVPAGQILITVDLAAQTLSIFRAGYEIGVAVILYGADEKPTPLGTFPITEKDADHVSNLYDAKMPYMLRLTGDGISIHGSSVEENTATHGCIGVPIAFARLMFDQVKLGDRVVITDGQMLRIGAQVPVA